MSGPTRQRSLRERLHGIAIPWQGRKSRTFHSKDGQTLSQSEETKSGVVDSRSCDPIPTTEESKEPLSRTESELVPNPDQENQDSKKHLNPGPPTDEQQAPTETKPPAERKLSSQIEKKLLSRSFTQPKGTEEYLVKDSDTLNSVAARFDTTPSELAKLNRLSARMIFSGQLLFVPEKKANGSSFGAPKDNKDGENNSSDGNKLEVSGNGEGYLNRRKVSVTDALRIPYRRHSDRMQRFLKVKARHFTDGQGVVAGVLIITPNAVMFDPHVSDPLVIEHGIESYGVIAPLDMVMRTAIYFDIAHMKVKNAPESALRIPKPDVYFGKMNNASQDEKDTDVPSQAASKDDNESKSEVDSRVQETEIEDSKADEQEKGAEKQVEEKTGSNESTEVDAAVDTSDKGPTSEENVTSKEELSREGSLDKEVSDAFANDVKKTSSATSSVDSPTPSPTLQQPDTPTEKHESRRERMLKRLSYPMESITSYTQSSLSRILSSSPKSFVDFSSGLFVRTSEEDKAKDSAQVPTVPEEQETKEEEDTTTPVLQEQGEDVEQPKTPKNESQAESAQSSVEEKNAPAPQPDPTTSVGYKNLVDEKPELFAALDLLLRQSAAQEQEGQPLYLCLRMGHPKERKMASTPILSYGKKKAKSEYWFSIPHNRVEDLYNFLQQWFPQIYGEVDEADPEALGFVPIDDTIEDEEIKEDNEEVEETEEAETSSAPRSFLKLVEDHFGFRSISPTDWEVLSMSESEKICFADFELPLPELLSPSDIFEEDHVKELCVLLPARAVGYPWTLIFSTSTQGFNLKTLYRKMSAYDTPVLLAITDTESTVFGSLVSSPLRLSDHFYGNGETFLFTFHPEFKVFKWTGDNMYFVKGGVDSIAFGAGDGQFGLWIDGDLNHGRSQRCLTFDNDVLSKEGDFVVKTLEVWGFV